MQTRVAAWLVAGSILGASTAFAQTPAPAAAGGPLSGALQRQYANVKRNVTEAAEAIYWSGVSRYKATGDAAALGETAESFTREHQDSPWATKASVWKK